MLGKVYSRKGHREKELCHFSLAWAWGPSEKSHGPIGGLQFFPGQHPEALPNPCGEVKASKIGSIAKRLLLCGQEANVEIIRFQAVALLWRTTAFR